MKVSRGNMTSIITTSVSTGLVIAGLFGVIIAEHSKSLSTNPLGSTTYALNQTQPAEHSPTAIKIDALGLDLTVREGTFDQSKQDWSIDDANAYFALGTATPIIYGHNTDEVFAPVRKAKAGDIMTITYSDGSTKQFAYKDHKLVDPNDASVLAESNPNSIILLTCEGFFNESRRLAYFTELA